MNKTVSVVVPCFNEFAVIASTHTALDRSLGASQNLNFEFIYVDDGSSDGTSSILRDIRKRDPRVKLVRFSRNFGHQAAVSAGIDHAFGDAVAIMDADLQDPPQVLLAMLEKWREGFEVVYGVRRKRKEGIFKRVCYRAFYLIWQKMADIQVPLDSGDFCVMDRQVADVSAASPKTRASCGDCAPGQGFANTVIPMSAMPGMRARQNIPSSVWFVSRQAASSVFPTCRCGSSRSPAS